MRKVGVARSQEKDIVILIVGNDYVFNEALNLLNAHHQLATKGMAFFVFGTGTFGKERIWELCS